MKGKLIILLATIFIRYDVSAQTVPSCSEVLSDAYQQASRENKNVLLIFHASWCGWCHLMDTSLADPAVKPFFDKNYVITHLTVYESKGKEQLENPGALDFLAKHGGNNQGIPFWIILDKKGVTLADSRLNGTNTGCPAREEEVEHFISVLRKTSSISEAEVKTIRDRFRKNDR